MTPRRKKRLTLVGLLVLGVGGAAALLLAAFSENLVYFHTPTEVAEGGAPMDRKFRIGGLVAEDSVRRDDDSLGVRFRITDTAETVTVQYEGVLPDLFREGQGVVADGRLTADNVFEAERVLAKHDENYMPPEAADALEQAKTGYAPESGTIAEQ